MVKKQKKGNIFTQSQIKKLNKKYPLAQPNSKNFRFGNAVRPRIMKSRFVRWPRFVQIQHQNAFYSRELNALRQ